MEDHIPETDPEETQELDAAITKATLEQNKKDDEAAAAYRQPGKGAEPSEKGQGKASGGKK